LGRINSIRALPHIGGKGIKKKSMIGEEHRYFPLLRGIQETPVVGDPVLLCTFGGRQYYLGPLNTQGNPNFNSDFFDSDEVKSGKEKGLFPDEEKVSLLFVQKDFKRLQKPLNKKLDNPLYDGEDFIGNSIHGDLVFEGRHGNSLRIGSRNQNPNMIISNGRSLDSFAETSLDGTIISILHRGTIRDHFNLDKKSTGKNVHSDDGKKDYKFALADDELENVYRSISKCLAGTIHKNEALGYLARGGVKVKGTEFSANDELYEYNKDQIFASSGRITFNARSDSIFLSAYKHIHIGCGSSMTLSTSRNILVEAAESVITNTPLFKVDAGKFVYIDGREKIVFGNPLKNDITHSAVLGEALVTQLVMIIDEIKNLAWATTEAIENRRKTGASVDTLNNVVEGLLKIKSLIFFGDILPSSIVTLPTILSKPSTTLLSISTEAPVFLRFSIASVVAQAKFLISSIIITN
jgi:hypothetical protein